MTENPAAMVIANAKTKAREMIARTCRQIRFSRVACPSKYSSGATTKSMNISVLKLITKSFKNGIKPMAIPKAIAT